MPSPQPAKTPYLVLARKYRPQAFDEVLGQPAVSVTLKNALASKRIHHAYLFTGPRGVGKTTMARLLAKALNCVKGPTPEPCGKCNPCHEIASASCLDVLEMDAASHTGVDNVREIIIETVALAPNRDRYKVFIIDEAHMLSTAAFNALLKTLEEPPPHVVFVLATTEAAKVPATIASRCQRYKFRPIAADIIEAHLKGLAAKEKISVEPQALELLARNAEGSLRDAVGLLDQCRSFTDGTVTADLVREMFGLVREDLLLGLAQALLGKDAAVLAERLRRIYKEGVEPSQLLKDLRAGLHRVYLGKVGLGEQAGEAWAEALKRTSAEALRFLLERVNKTLEDLRFGDSPHLSLELGLFGCVEAAGDVSQWVQRLEELEKKLPKGYNGLTVPSRPDPEKENQKSDLNLITIWDKVIGQIREERPSLAAILETATPAQLPDGSCKICCRRTFDLVQIQRNQVLIEDKLATFGWVGEKIAWEVGNPANGAQDASDSEAPQEEGSDLPGPEAGLPSGPSSLDRAGKILGGTVRFIKKKS